MRDKEKVDKEGKELGSGIGYVEFKSELVVDYILKHLNNLQLGGSKKGLICDMAVEDARMLLKR